MSEPDDSAPNRAEPYCWLCDDPASCEMCRPDEPGQLGLFEVSADRRLILQDGGGE